MSRPIPESGQFELTVVEFSQWKRTALADHHLTHEEGMRLVYLTERMARRGNAIVRSMQFASRVLTGARGMDSVSVRRSWNERQAELVYLDEYRDDDPKTAA